MTATQSSQQLTTGTEKQITPAEAKKIVNQIIKLAKDYTAKNIQKWRTAMKSAENPYYPARVLLYDLYSDLELDNHYFSLVRRSRLDVTGVPFQLVQTNKTKDEEMTNLFQKKWFREFCEHVIDTQFMGFSLLELQEADPTNNVVRFELVERKNVVPEFGAWTVYQGTTNYVYYRNNPDAMKWLIEVGDKKDLGLLNKMANMVLYKKVAMLCHSEFTERFGMPMMKAKTNTRDMKAVDALEKFLRQMAAKSYAIIDTSEELDFVAASGTDAFDVFDKLTERTNSEMSKLVRLQTLTTDAGNKGARSLGDVHQVSNDDVSQYNRDYVSELVNEKLLPLLAEHGFATKGLKFIFITKKAISNDEFTQDQWLDNTFDIDFDWWAEKYQVPIKGRKQQAQPQTPPFGANYGENEEGEDEQQIANKKPQKGKKSALAKQVPYSILKMHADLNNLYNHSHHACNG